jgi:RNA polymerase sigma-70 factor, ECF subfamily
VIRWRTALVEDTVTLTQQLQAFSAGDRKVAESILREILPKLHEIAARHLRKERYAAPVSPTELINEVWIRNLHKGGWQIRNREHFYAIAACAMRRVLVDYARARLASKCGSLTTTGPLDEAVELSDNQSARQIVEIGLLMDKLSQAQPKTRPIVDLHYFAGFSFEEIAEITGLSPRQVRHLWNKGRDWLKDRMTPPPDRAQSVGRTAAASGDAVPDRTPGRSRASPPIPSITE